MDVRDYLINELNMKEPVADIIMNEFAGHPDIIDEFQSWIDTGVFSRDDPVRVEGYTAEDIHKMAPQLSASGYFSMLAALRDHPEEAKKIIAEGLKQR